MALDNIFSIDCDTLSCNVGSLGAIELFDPSCPNKLVKSELGYLLIMHPTVGIPPADWTKAGTTGWGAVIDNTDSTDVFIKRIPIIGDKPVEERSDIIGTNGAVFKGDGVYTVNATILDVADQLYDYMRKFQCGKILPYVWFEDNDGNMYGQNDGIKTTSFLPSFPLERGQESYAKIDIAITFRAQTDPDRIASPLQ